MRPIFVPLLLAIAPLWIGAQQPAPSLSNDIAAIRAVDDHTHASRAFSASDTLDPDSDALQCPQDGAGNPPQRLTEISAFVIRGWRAMYGYPYDDATPAHAGAVPALRLAAWRAHGQDFPALLLDSLGTEIAFANRVSMKAGLPATRFRWVALVDALAFPLDTRGLRINPDRAQFFAAEERLAARFRAALGVRSLPPTLDAYVAEVVIPTLQRMKREGAIAVKFELAYLRSLEVDPAPHDVAARTYTRFAHGGVPPTADHRVLQDYLIRAIVREAGRLELTVQFHTGGGCGGYFDLAGSQPTHLSALFNDPEFRGTKFVLLHGGGVYWPQVIFLMSKSNVFADLSAFSFYSSPRTLAGIVRAWLEARPDNVLFGTDYSSSGPGTDDTETAYVTTMSTRAGITLAIEGMVADGEISRERGLELARMVLRENAIRAYQLELPVAR